jgi:hypothetical protein
MMSEMEMFQHLRTVVPVPSNETMVSETLYVRVRKSPSRYYGTNLKTVPQPLVPSRLHVMSPPE